LLHLFDELIALVLNDPKKVVVVIVGVVVVSVNVVVAIVNVVVVFVSGRP
jgi:hypothetical protein